jgi:putative heme iron utilization protein
MDNVIAFPNPKTNAELIAAIEGFRHQLDNFAHVTSANLSALRAMIERLAAVTP